jgi:hypothetical protein
MRGKKQQTEKPKPFIIMNSRLEYFAGMMYGGQLVWSNDYNEAKPLDHINKFNTLKHLSYGEELILDYI